MTPRASRIVITGALGHIGSALVQVLPEYFPHCDLILIDSARMEESFIRTLPPGITCEFVAADVLNAPLQKIMGYADAVIHLAALTSPEDSFQQPLFVREVNVEGALRVASACIELQIPFFFPSTTSVYSRSGIIDESEPASAMLPQTPYARWKLEAEQTLSRLSSERGLLLAIGRFGTIFGPSAGMKFHTAVNRFCRQAFAGEPVTVWETAWDQRRPYLDVRDAARGISFVIARDLFRGGIYHWATQHASVREILNLIRMEKQSLRVIEVPSPAMNTWSYDVTTEKVQSLGFRFEGCLKEGIRETFEKLALKDLSLHQ